MREVIACSAFAAAVTLAVGRPRIWSRWQVGPASAAGAGVIALLASGVVQFSDLAAAVGLLWRPFVTILSIMMTTAAARRLGLIDSLALRIFAAPGRSVPSLFTSVFALGAVTASVLNNDAAVLLLTPLVLALVRHRYPSHPHLRLPFAFAVFMAAGVAPFVVSNPMNMIVASYAGLSFNGYAARMLPISIVVCGLTLILLRVLFRSELNALMLTAPAVDRAPALNAGQKAMATLLALVLGSYPIVASVDTSTIWLVSAGGAVLALLLVWQQRCGPPGEMLRRETNWEILIFLPAVFILALGLRNVGLVDYLSSVYRGAGIGVIGTTAALGSAALNNHPMAMMNMFALGSTPGAGSREFLSALVGGDLGPRLLPVGSLAGLLWLEACRQAGLEISFRQFVTVGAVLTLPTLAVALVVLSLF